MAARTAAATRRDLLRSAAAAHGTDRRAAVRPSLRARGDRYSDDRDRDGNGCRRNPGSGAIAETADERQRRKARNGVAVPGPVLQAFVKGGGERTPADMVPHRSPRLCTVAHRRRDISARFNW